MVQIEMTDPVPAPVLVGRWPARMRSATCRGVGVTVINFNTSTQTLRCLESLSACDESPAWVLVLDNASQLADFERLQVNCTALKNSELRLYRSEVNLGFAAGSNFLLAELMAERCCRFLGLLNNDAVAQPAMVTRLVDAVASNPSRVGIAGGRMHKLDAPDRVDTLGITIYASLMPADRHDVADPFLGPTGGCCIMSRELVTDLLAVSGYCFDARFFCYCEDTDLVTRANLLGYEPAYVDELVALHEGQASTGGSFNQFIAYHGIRNTIWLHMKLMPRPLLWRHGFWLLLAHAMTVARHLLAGRGGLLVAVYRDAWAQRHAFCDEHRRLNAHVRLSPNTLERRFAPRFYRSGYFRLVLSQLWREGRRSRRVT